jgi:hypothetical protein
MLVTVMTKVATILMRQQLRSISIHSQAQSLHLRQLQV